MFVSCWLVSWFLFCEFVWVGGFGTGIFVLVSVRLLVVGGWFWVRDLGVCVIVWFGVLVGLRIVLLACGWGVVGCLDVVGFGFRLIGLTRLV